MRIDDVYALMLRVLVEVIGVRMSGDLTPDMRLFGGDLALDELDLVEFVMQIEARLDIDLPDQDIEQALTVGALAELVLRQVPANAK